MSSRGGRQNPPGPHRRFDSLMHTFLSQTAEYALRAVAWLALRSPREPVLVRDLSEGTEIPAQYLAKVLRRLVLAGLLDSRKGRGGGFTLARPPKDISFRDVLVAIDTYPKEGRCAFGWGACNASQPCLLHGSWSSMSERFRAWASQTTFANMQAMHVPVRASRRRRSGTRKH